MRVETIRLVHVVEPVIAIQNQYSMMRENPEKELLSMPEKLGIAFVSFSSLSKDFLTGKIDKYVTFPE